MRDVVTSKPQPPESYPGEFYRAVVGSVIHGLNVPGTDDIDLMGVCIEPASLSIGIKKPFEQHEFRSAGGQNPSGPGDTDLTVYSLRKYVYLASRGNPSIINLLFVPAEYVHVSSTLAGELRNLTYRIVSREAAARYRGYLKQQRERLIGVRGQKRTGSNRRKYFVTTPNGKEMDGKYAMHMVRLGIQGVELMETGKITLPMPEPYRTEVLGMREGVYDQADVVDWAEQLEARLSFLTIHSDLPEHPQTDYLNDWVTEAYLDRWTHRV